MKLHLACGNVYKDGWVNVDASGNVKADYYTDLLKFPWKWEDSSVDEIYTSHFIEHIGDEFRDFMAECWRVLKPGGTMTHVAPYYTSIRAVQDPTHKRFISEVLWSYLNRDWLKENGIGHYDMGCDFKVKQIMFHMPEEYKGIPEAQLEHARVHMWNVVTDIEAILEAIK